MDAIYDHVVITLILIVDSGLLWLAWRAENRRTTARMKRKFNRILSSVGLR